MIHAGVLPALEKWGVLGDDITDETPEKYIYIIYIYILYYIYISLL